MKKIFIPLVLLEPCRVEHSYSISSISGIAFLLLIILFPLQVFADDSYHHISKPVTGNYEDASSWEGLQPSEDMTANLTISKLSVITRHGDLFFKEAQINGTLNVNGSFTSRGKVVTVKKGGRLEIFKNMDGHQIDVEKGGVLIVHGNMNLTGGNCHFNGNVIVLGNANLKELYMGDTGNLVVGGSCKIPGGGGEYSKGDIFLIDSNAGFELPSWMRDNVKPKNEDELFNSNDDELLDILDGLGLLSKGWTGIKSSDWNDKENWNPRIVPGILSDVVVAPRTLRNEPHITGSVQIGSLTIKKGKLTIAAGAQMTIWKNLIVKSPGSLVIENDFGYRPASFLCKGQSTGDVTVRNIFPALARNWYVGHPVVTNSNNYFDNGFSVWRYGHSSEGEEWTDEQKNSVYASPTEAFVVNKGKGEAKTIEHQGALSNEDASFQLVPSSKGRWNLLANPYNAYYDPIFLLSDGVRNMIEGTIWYRTVNAQKYYEFSSQNIFENINLPTQSADLLNRDAKLIAPMQAFWVRSTGEPGSIAFKKQLASHSKGDNPALKSIAAPANDVVYLELDNGKTKDQTAVTFRPSGNDGYCFHDSEKRLNEGEVPNLYFVKGGRQIAIAIMPVLESYAEMSLGYTVQKSFQNMVIRGIAMEQFMPGMNVWLHDTQTGAKINMREHEYSFTSDVAIDNERFVLTVEPVSTGLAPAEKLEELIRIFNLTDKVVVVVDDELLALGHKHHFTVCRALYCLCSRLIIAEPNWYCQTPVFMCWS